MLFAQMAVLSTILAAQTGPRNVEPGNMTIIQSGREIGFCPLERTSVNAQISGFGAEVTVVQKFKNNSATPIEAVYTFPLPNDAAVGRMSMKIGDRVIEGQIKKRDEARQIYERAKASGQAAALLDQERSNIFTQNVANVLPGHAIEVEITYVQVLKFDSGEFEFNFPMVVGPRFLGNAQDPAKIDPPRTTRTGTNIGITVDIRSGGNLRGIRSVLHEIDQKPLEDGATRVTFRKDDEVPNKDFILRYTISGDEVDTAFVSHVDKRGGFFSLVVLPPKQPREDQIAPREIIFVMDQSGSQSGFPIEKSKELTLGMIQTLRRGDTFNVLGFNNDVRKLWTAPRPVSPENLNEARSFVTGLQANGGTQLRAGVEAALMSPPDPRRLRIVLFNTDGFIGDEAMVLDTIQKQRNVARMFTFGIGNSVNRYLIDAMASEGKGDADYVTLAEQADGAIHKFSKRMQSPILTDLRADFEGGGVTDVQPRILADVFADRPIVIHGRFATAAPGSVTLRGKVGGREWTKTVPLPFARANAPAVPVLWARKKVSEIERGDYLVALKGRGPSTSESAITQLGLDYGIMTPFTSFVAVEQRVINVGGKQRTVNVPVEQADGVTFGGHSIDFITHDPNTSAILLRGAPAANKSASTSGGLNRGSGGFGGGFGGGGGGLGGGGFGGATGGTGGTTATTGGGGTGTGKPPTVSGPPAVNKAKAESRDQQAVDSLKTMKAEERVKNKKLFIEAKVHPKLRSKVGKIEVQVFVDKFDEKTLNLLKAKGIKVDDKDASLKVVFAVIDAAKLGDLAILDEVTRIDPL